MIYYLLALSLVLVLAMYFRGYRFVSVSVKRTGVEIAYFTSSPKNIKVLLCKSANRSPPLCLTRKATSLQMSFQRIAIWCEVLISALGKISCFHAAEAQGGLRAPLATVVHLDGLSTHSTNNSVSLLPAVALASTTSSPGTRITSRSLSGRRFEPSLSDAEPVWHKCALPRQLLRVPLGFFP